jgi:hypothetical protein
MTKAAATKYAVETIRELRRLAAEAQKLGDKKAVAAYEVQIDNVTQGWA